MEVGRLRASMRDRMAGALRGEAGGLRRKQPGPAKLGTLSWGHWGATEGLSRRGGLLWSVLQGAHLGRWAWGPALGQRE